MAKTVVIVHEGPEHRDEYCKILWYNGFDVEIVDTPGDALIAAQAGGVDLVLLGLVGRSTTSLELCRALATARAGRAVPVLVVASRAELDVARAARLAGCAAYLEEPAAGIEVLFAVERLIGRADADERHEPKPKPPPLAAGEPVPAESPLQAVVEPSAPEPLLRVEVQGQEASGEGVDPMAPGRHITQREPPPEKPSTS